MSQTETTNAEKAPQTAAERKRLQRERDKSRGYVEITVRVPADRVDDARAWCGKLKPIRKKRDKSQTDLFEDVRDGSQGTTERSEVLTLPE